MNRKPFDRTYRRGPEILRGKLRRHKLRHKLKLLDSLHHSVIVHHPALDGSHLTELLLRRIGILPKGGIVSLLLLVLEVYSTLSDVKDTSPTNPVVL